MGLVDVPLVVVVEHAVARYQQAVSSVNILREERKNSCRGVFISFVCQLASAVELRPVPYL
jgi:hypothetical protein